MYLKSVEFSVVIDNDQDYMTHRYVTETADAYMISSVLNLKIISMHIARFSIQ